ncbi:MAG: MYXO-CTERM-anchored inactivated metalloprotease [Hyalangium sp.]|uniref:MYXO-CTERM-anchored inactivated metalloprotease n=1 Tax=Hyalangium sp. TaxID=2028555 RepID=UPI00389A57A4
MSPHSPILLSLFVLFFGVSSAHAQAYERARTHQPDGHVLCRSSRTFTYSLATSADHPTAQERAAITAAFNTWQQAASTCSDLVFQQAADVPNGTPLLHDEKTLVTFRKAQCRDVVPPEDACWNDDSCGDKYDCWARASSDVVFATVTYLETNGAIADANIELNASLGTLTTADGPPCARGVVAPGCVAGDVQSLVTRSIGETLGLALVQRTDSTMSLALPWGDTQKRVIDPGTLQGLCTLYPRGQPTPECEDSHLPDAGTPGDTEPPPSNKSGCSATTSAPLLGALVLLLGARRRRGSPSRGNA